METRHVYPLDDLRDHFVDDEVGGCECRPTVVLWDDEAGLPLGGRLIIHNAYDLREMFESDGPWS